MKRSNRFHIKPDHSDLVENIFQEECRFSNMDAKFGKLLTNEENDIRHYILTQTPVLGRIPSIERIKENYSELRKEKIDSILNKLHEMDVIRFDEDMKTIIVAYPFSGLKTPHLVEIKKEGYKEVYSMCAIDALGISFMVGCDISINSRCYHCKDVIRIEIENNTITSLSPIDIVVWFDIDYSCCAASSMCKNTNFFSSKQHFAKWRKSEPKRNGYLLKIEEAFCLGRLFFENRLVI
jgi:hypothetical protein